MPLAHRKSSTLQDRPPVTMRDHKPTRMAWLTERLSSRIAEGFDAKIVGAGSYQCVSYKPKKKTSEMLMGLCQCCGRQIGASLGRIAHHGYERPSSGWQTHSCDGAMYAPLSDSCDRAADRAAWYAAQADATRLRIPQVDTMPIITITRYDRRLYRYELVNVTAETAAQYFDDTHPWQCVQSLEKKRLEAEANSLDLHASFLRDVVAHHQAGRYVGTTRLVTV